MESFHGNAFVGVHRIGPGRTTMVVILEDRAAFDLIDLPETDHQKPNSRVLTKSIDGAAHVIFQYWIDEPKP